MSSFLIFGWNSNSLGFLKERGLFIIAVIMVMFLKSCQPVPQKSKIELSTVPGTTSNAENLTRETNEPSHEFYPRISPNGKFLLYQNSENEKVIIESANSSTVGSLFKQPSVVNKVGHRSAIVRKEVGSQIRSPLVQDARDATWLADGSGVIFSYRKPAQPVIVRTGETGVGLNYISQGAMGGDDAEPNMTTDGKKVIFTTLIGNSRMICSMNSQGGEFTVLTDGNHVAINPTDNDQIIYNLTINNRVQIFTMNLRTGQKTQLTSGEYDCRDGAFSKDGRWIAYSSNQDNPTSKNYHIYMMRPNGTDVKQLTQGDTHEGDPCWSPDGLVFFYSNASGNYNIWKVKPRM
ncbi:TolB family protein [Runella salmonicolor]|uniref:DUF5050 domain-containing protein n=1 Tax=Runella salmonicolor TaxID=2950278 RepID=A0ABT1FQB8_9BACT|nr:DUF5050 domain-containing protein [Runella salmonicolor]MCP1382697.1 DUF5050 domain-containing protein [Runella salmonicolor]